VTTSEQPDPVFPVETDQQLHAVGSLARHHVLLPWLLFGLVGGALVDRWDRRRVMWLADLFRFALLAGVTALVMAGAADVYLLFAVAFLLGIGQIFFDTASLAYLPELLEREPAALRRANARLQGTG
jgi:MFS family permease